MDQKKPQRAPQLVLEKLQKQIDTIDSLLRRLAEGGLSKEEASSLETAGFNLDGLRRLARDFSESLEVSDDEYPADSTSPEKSLKILVVEDDAVQQLFASRVLERRGHQVVVAASGERGLELARSEKFDLILMDCQMPTIDGFEVTRRIRADEKTSGTHVRIVAFTAHCMAGYQQHCLEVGMDDYIRKPITAEELIERVEEAPIPPCEKDPS